MNVPQASNTSIVPAAIDVLLAVPRFARRAGAFALDNIPGNIFHGGSIIADATSRKTANSTITNTSAAMAHSTAVRLDAAIREGFTNAGSSSSETTSSMFGFVLQFVAKLKNFGGIFAYLTSRWALATFTAAIILNRAQFYASSRERLRLKWYMRLALYLGPILLFLNQLQIVLQTMRCQTSPDFALLRYGDPLKHLMIDFAGSGGFLYNLSSTLLFWQDDAGCCAARSMSLIAAEGDRSELRGSMSILFGFFLTLCGSQLFETLACALQGRQPMPETGMTIFEHSLAFAECEAMISSALGFGFFGIPKLESQASTASAESVLITRSDVLQRLNVPPEVLLVCVISCFSHLTSAILAVSGLRDKVRLINSGIWACSYMGAFIWSFIWVILYPSDNFTDIGILRFPTVCIVGFIPHLLVFIGIVVCSIIYGIAFLITAFSIPDEALAEMSSFKDRFAWAYHNLQANVQFSQASSIRIKMSEDFYTTLLKVGFSVLTAASEAVYLNEGCRIKMADMTWVERQRIDELASNIENHRRVEVPTEILGEGIAKGIGFLDHQHLAISVRSPYARERRSRPVKKDADKVRHGSTENGLGIIERRGRFQLTSDFLNGMFWLIAGLQARITMAMLDKVGLNRRPAWLIRAAGVSAEKTKDPAPPPQPTETSLDFWMLGADGNVTVPQGRDVDVEAETRRRLDASGQINDEETLSDNLYHWWRSGGWWGDVDNSGDYQAQDLDDDATSLYSMATDTSAASDVSESMQSGQLTPTQSNPYADWDVDKAAPTEAGLDLSLLPRLLNPQSAADREEARLLSYTLQSSRPMTRSQYRRSTNHDRSQLLSAIRPSAAPRSEEEEELDLEHFILSQRSKKASQKPAASGSGGSWESGAEGLGSSGPQCVVCQSAPRTVLVWPCGCLSMCDECRMGLAARNHSKCICCRTDMVAYSRLYVP